MEPAAPKVSISNMMRVMGNEAIMDPTALEARVRKQVSQRIRNHDERNAARKLTPAERREKKKKKCVVNLVHSLLSCCRHLHRHFVHALP